MKARPTTKTAPIEIDPREALDGGVIDEGEAEAVEEELEPLVGVLELPLAVGLGAPPMITELTVRLEVGEREMVVLDGGAV